MQREISQNGFVAVAVWSGGRSAWHARGAGGLASLAAAFAPGFEGEFERAVELALDFGATYSLCAGEADVEIRPYKAGELPPGAAV